MIEAEWAIEVTDQLTAIRKVLSDYGVDWASTTWLAQEVINNGRDVDYIHALAAKPNTENIAGWLNFAIRNNRNSSIVAPTNMPENSGEKKGDEDERLRLIKIALSSYGITVMERNKLAMIAYNNGRDAGFINAHASKPNTRDLPAYLNFAITQNLPPPKATTTTSGAGGLVQQEASDVLRRWSSTNLNKRD